MYISERGAGFVVVRSEVPEPLGVLSSGRRKTDTARASTDCVMRLSLVAAVAANGVIGADGTLPWHYPEDLAHFRETTVGHPVVMGRRTFEAIAADLGGPLPDRRNVVLTSRPGSLPETVTPVTSLSAALEVVRAQEADTAYVVGGGSVYRQFLPRADELVLTELDEPYEGDTTFPDVDWDRWRVAERERHDQFDIVRYVRVVE